MDEFSGGHYACRAVQKAVTVCPSGRLALFAYQDTAIFALMHVNRMHFADIMRWPSPIAAQLAANGHE